VSLLLNGLGELVTNDTKKAEVLSALFASFLTGEAAFLVSQGKSGVSRTYPRQRMTKLRSPSTNWMYISPWRPDMLHSQLLRTVAHDTVRQIN